MRRLVVLTLFMIVLLSACRPTLEPAPTETPALPAEPPVAAETSIPPSNPPASVPPAFEWLPRPGDDQLTRDTVTLTTAEITSPENSPYQFVLHLAGDKPTPCHQLRVSRGQPVNNELQVEVFSLVKPGEACTSVIQFFDVNVPLEAPAGQYSVVVNGEKIGEIMFLAQ